MQLDLTLNVLWLLLGALAIIVTIVASSRQSGSTRWRLAGAVLVVAGLFPFISATDDILRVEHYATEHESSDHASHHSRQHRTTSGDDLIRLYEAMDAPVTPDSLVLTFVPFFVFFVTIFCRPVLTGSTPHASGRSPPALFIAA